MPELELGEHLSLCLIAICAVIMGSFGMYCGVDGVLSGGIVAVLASIAAFIAGRATGGGANGG